MTDKRYHEMTPAEKIVYMQQKMATAKGFESPVLTVPIADLGIVMAALEDERKRNKAYENLVRSKDKTITEYSKIIDDQTTLIQSMTSEEIESQRNANAQLTDALQSSERRIAKLEQRLQQPIKLPDAFVVYTDQHGLVTIEEDNEAGWMFKRDEVIATLKEQGFKVEGE